MKVSIITPAYNQVDFLEKTLLSVLEQDYPNIEYIVLDDGSTDETPQLMANYQNRLHYFRHENQGESKTVNRGYALSKGDIIGVVNSDDPLYSKQAVSEIVACFQAHPRALAVYPDWVSIDEHDKVIAIQQQPLFTLPDFLLGDNASLGPGMFIKRSALEQIGYRNENLKYTGDLAISFKLALLGELAHVPKVLATHRVHAAAASSTAQGAIMAAEVFDLAQFCVNSPLLPESLQPQKKRILANFSTIAINFCGKNVALKWHYFFQAFSLSPFFALRWLCLSLIRPIVKPVRKLINFPTADHGKT